jgi:hypothetical protein
MHATPDLQHEVPHGVWPGQQQVTVAGSEHVSFLPQHPWPQNVMMLGSHPHLPVLALMQIRLELQQVSPHGVLPGGHGPVSWPWARKGRRTVAAVAPIAAVPIILMTPRRDIPFAVARVSLSNPSLMPLPPWQKTVLLPDRVRIKEA